MLTPEENIRLTETGPETAAGKVLRSYWQPVALTEELDGERPVKAVTLMNEQLVLFKAADGEYRLSGRFCPHRGVDLSYGRLEADTPVKENMSRRTGVPPRSTSTRADSPE